MPWAALFYRGRFKQKMAYILGKKVKMTQVWKGDKLVPVTVIQADPNEVAIVRTSERDGYDAVQLKLGRNRCEFLGETTLKLGDKIDVSTFKEGDMVKVSGLTKGRGFQGVVKRHGFGGGPQTHGQKNRLRAPGSIGSTAPQRVWPGRRMAGHMGQERVSLLNLEVAEINTEENTISLKGAVPGGRGTVLEIRSK